MFSYNCRDTVDQTLDLSPTGYGYGKHYHISSPGLDSTTDTYLSCPLFKFSLKTSSWS